ncbi:hypothetical protein IPM62_02010 [Candidatus Woesebacteria bacterium]|nr:MAG: hypothetical protein IPM62_02010 [Candidatus Woesebacteria bacterium]
MNDDPKEIGEPSDPVAAIRENLGEVKEKLDDANEDEESVLEKIENSLSGNTSSNVNTQVDDTQSVADSTSFGGGQANQSNPSGIGGGQVVDPSDPMDTHVRQAINPNNSFDNPTPDETNSSRD